METRLCTKKELNDIFTKSSERDFYETIIFRATLSLKGNLPR